MPAGTATNRLQPQRLTVDGRSYRLDVLRQVVQPPEAPRLVVVGYQPAPTASAMLRACIRAVQRFTPEPHELWIIDNHSHRQHARWLLEHPGINVVLNYTEPLAPPYRTPWGFWQRGKQRQRLSGSYANALALELAVRLIDPQSHYLMPLHMDTMPCLEGWLSHLQAQIGGTVGAAGVRMDTARLPEGVLHVLGYMVDFQLFRRLKLDFLPDLPTYDVGDRVTVDLRRAGYEVVASPNSLWQPDLIDQLPADSPLRQLHVDRSFNQAGEVFFLHLGRGVSKAAGERRKGTTPQEWLAFAETLLER